jgi:hypothetical protein
MKVGLGTQTWNRTAYDPGYRWIGDVECTDLTEQTRLSRAWRSVSCSRARRDREMSRTQISKQKVYGSQAENEWRPGKKTERVVNSHAVTRAVV